MSLSSKRSKFGNKKSVCLSKHVHDSRFEADYCNRLFAMKQGKEIKDFMTQVSFPMVVGPALICNHIVDFVVVLPSSECEAHEVKGFKTDVWSIKRKLFRALYPTYKYITITKEPKRRPTWPKALLKKRNP